MHSRVFERNNRLEIILSDHHAALMLTRFFFFNDPATTEIYTLSLHDALPISARRAVRDAIEGWCPEEDLASIILDRKSTRLNSSHVKISYAVFCLKKKKK